MDLPFRWKLLGTVGLVLVLAAALVVAAYRTAVGSRAAAAQVGHTLRVLDLASEAEAGVVAMESAYRTFVVTGSDDGLVRYSTGSSLYHARLGDLQAEVAQDPPEGGAWREVDQRVLAWRTAVTEPIIQLRREVAAGRASLDDLAALDRTGEPARQFEAVRAAFAQAIQARERVLAEQTPAADQANAALQRLLITGILAVVVVGVGVAWLLAWHLTRPVALLARTARGIADGDLSRRVNLGRRDEVGLARRTLQSSYEVVSALGMSAELRFEDEGPGIPPEDLERIFEQFVRGAAARSSVPGTGLGLAICRGIVRANDGRIWAENRPGGGAAFVVWLPLARAEA